MLDNNLKCVFINFIVVLQQDFEKFKTVNVISKEAFDQIIPQEKVETQEVPPPPPPVETAETGILACLNHYLNPLVLNLDGHVISFWHWGG